MLSLATLSELAPAFWSITCGTPQTCLLIIGAMLIGFIGGVPFACLEVYGPNWSKNLVKFYVWFFRGVPILILLFLFHFSIFPALGKFINIIMQNPDNKNIFRNMPIFISSVFTLGLTSCAYQSQIFRGSLQSLPQGQFKAAQALGMSKLTALKSIIIPQALRISIPAWSNEFSILLKDSAVVFALGGVEIMGRAKQLAANPDLNQYLLLIYIFAGLLYFILTLIGVNLLKILQNRTKIIGLGVDPEKK